MSKYLAYTGVVFKDKKLLLQALAECGFTTVEEGDAIELGRYWSQQTQQTAHLVIRRAVVAAVTGYAYGDLAFRLTEAGYVPVVDHYDEQHQVGGRPLLVAIRTAYSKRVIQEVSKRVRGTMVAHAAKNGVVKIQVRF